MLCIDVSGSMDGKPILEAVRGAKKFVDEAVEARYKVGVMLWNTQRGRPRRADGRREGGDEAARPRRKQRLRRQRPASARWSGATRSSTSSRTIPTGWWRSSAMAT